MDKVFFIFLASLLMSSGSSAQSTKEKMQGQLKASDREKQGAKADIYIIGRDKISDTVVCKNRTKTIITKRRKYKAIKKSYNL